MGEMKGKKSDLYFGSIYISLKIFLVLILLILMTVSFGTDSQAGTVDIWFHNSPPSEVNEGEKINIMVGVYYTKAWEDGGGPYDVNNVTLKDNVPFPDAELDRISTPGTVQNETTRWYIFSNFVPSDHDQGRGYINLYAHVRVDDFGIDPTHDTQVYKININREPPFEPYFSNARITNRTDQDGDGYSQEFDVEFDVDSNVEGYYYVKVYKDSTFDTFLNSSSTFSVNGTATDYRSVTINCDDENLNHDNIDLKLDLFDATTDQRKDQWGKSDDGDLGSIKVELSSEDLSNHRPPPPGQITADQIDLTSARVSWGASIDEDGDSVSYEVIYKTHSAINWNPGGTTDRTYIYLTNLEWGTGYDVRVKAFDGKIYSEWRIEDEDVFKTLDPPYLIKPSPVSINDYERFIVPRPNRYPGDGSQSDVLCGSKMDVYYKIKNPSPISVSVILGCTIKAISEPYEEIYDQSNDIIVVIPGNTTIEKFRSFTIPYSASEGIYDVIINLWPQNTDFSGSHYDSYTWNNLVSIESNDLRPPEIQLDYSGSGNNRIALILIPGLHNEKDPEYWNDFIDFFKEREDLKNHFDLYHFHYDGAFLQPHESGKQLVETFEDWSIPGTGLSLREKYSNGRVILLAHSLGGLVSRYAMNEKLSTGVFFGEKVFKLITLATPHHGTPIAVPMLIEHHMINDTAFPTVILGGFLDDLWSGDPSSFSLSLDNDENIPSYISDPVTSSDFERQTNLLEKTKERFGPTSENHLQSAMSPYLSNYPAEKYINKIIAIGGNNEPSTDGKANYIENATYETDDFLMWLLSHNGLGRMTYVMSFLGVDQSMYDENDGYVPLYSALFEGAPASIERINISADWGIQDVDHLTFLDNKKTLYTHVDLFNKIGDKLIEEANNLVGGPTPTPTRPTVLSVAPQERHVGWQAGNTTFSVSNDGGGTMIWQSSVITGSSWLSILSGSSGTNTGIINASFNENPGNTQRIGTIRIAASGATGSPKNVTVTQAGSEALSDLAVYDIFLSPNTSGEPVVTNPQIGDQVYIHARFTYDGPSVTVHSILTIDGDIWTEEVDPINPTNGTRLYHLTPWMVTEGSHTIRWEMDTTNVIYESNEANNSIDMHLTVNAPIFTPTDTPITPITETPFTPSWTPTQTKTCTPTPTDTPPSPTPTVPTTSSRTLPDLASPGGTVDVQIQIGGSGVTDVVTVNETIPDGWSYNSWVSGPNPAYGPAPGNTGSLGFLWHRVNRPLTFVYRLNVPSDETSGVRSFSGEYLVDVNQQDGLPIGGDTAIEVQHQNRCHPADTNHDFSLSIGEAVGFGSRWKQGANYPIGVVVRAGYLWKKGGYYQDIGNEPPGCWVPIQFTSKGNLDANTEKTLHDSKIDRFLNKNTMRILVFPASEVNAWGYEETLDEGLSPSRINENGEWDIKNRKIKWGPFLDNIPRPLRYAVRGDGSHSVFGKANFDGNFDFISEQNDFVISEKNLPYILLDGFGAVHSVGIEDFVVPDFYFGVDIAREILTVDNGYYMLDSYGIIHNCGDVKEISFPDYGGIDSRFDHDFAQSFLVNETQDGVWVLSKSGHIYTGGSAKLFEPDTHFEKINIAKDIEWTKDRLGYFVLDSFGGIHVSGSAQLPDVSKPPYFGWNIARNLEVSSSGSGFWVLDGFGAIHAAGEVQDFLPPPGGKWESLPYWGWDIAKDFEIEPENNGFILLDGFGGIHILGNIPAQPGFYFGWDIARDVEIIKH